MHALKNFHKKLLIKLPNKYDSAVSETILKEKIISALNILNVKCVFCAFQKIS